MLSHLLLALTVVACGGIDDTAALQNAVTAGDVRVSGACRVNGIVGVRIPSGRVLDLGTATFTMQPSCAPMCKVFETVPDAEAIDIDGGIFYGDLTPACSSCWRMFVRVDKARRVTVRRSVFRNSYTDAVSVGGNGAGSSDVVLSELDIRGSRRNGISVTNGSGVTIERSYIGEPAPFPLVGAGVDVEPNVGERVVRLVIRANRFHANVVAVYDHPGKGYPGEHHEISGNVMTSSGTHGVILNSVTDALLYGNDVLSAPIGISVGSATEDRRATRVKVVDNVIQATRALLLAGVRDVLVHGNDLGGGRPETPVLGVVGRFTVEPYAPPPPAEGVCE